MLALRCILAFVKCYVQRHQKTSQVVSMCQPCRPGLVTFRWPHGKRAEPCIPFGRSEIGAAGEVEHGHGQALAFGILEKLRGRMRAGSRQLRRHGPQDKSLILLAERWIERQLHHQVGRVRHRMAPALLLVVAAVVAHGAEVNGGGLDQFGALCRAQVGCDAVGPRHFAQHDGRERLGQSGRIHPLQACQLRRAQAAQGGQVQLPGAHPRLQHAEGNVVAQEGIRVAQAVDQAKRQRLTFGVVGHLSLGRLQFDQLGTRDAGRRAGRGCKRVNEQAADDDQESEGRAHEVAFIVGGAGPDQGLLLSVEGAEAAMPSAVSLGLSTAVDGHFPCVWRFKCWSG
jgi:hypothetical protein